MYDNKLLPAVRRVLAAPLLGNECPALLRIAQEKEEFLAQASLRRCDGPAWYEWACVRSVSGDTMQHCLELARAYIAQGHESPDVARKAGAAC